MSGIVLQMMIVLALSPLVSGIIKKIKAFSQKRVGPPLLQAYYDYGKLFRKEMVVSNDASWLFLVTPYIVFSVALLATAMIPASLYLTMPEWWGNIFAIVYLYAMGRFFLALAGMDIGTTFGGMGSSREMMIAAIMEPALLVALVTVSLICGKTQVHDMMSVLSTGSHAFNPALLLSMVAVVIVLMAETARIPFDDPSTHLELTMVHEAMLLEYSGRNLALMEWAAAIKQLGLMTLLVNVFLPGNLIQVPTMAYYGVVVLLVSLVTYLIKLVVLAMVIGVIEVYAVKSRLFSTPNLAAVAFIVAFLAFFQSFILGVIS